MTRVVLSCEHATAHVPAEWRTALRGAAAALRTHRGWDPGSAELGRDLRRGLRAPLVVARTTRLLVDANRSRDNPRVFSEWTRVLPAAVRAELIEREWVPHRRAVRAALDRALAAARDELVLHVSVHSFTPRLNGETRRADVALLYDPARPRERAFAARWLRALGELRPELLLRRNYPYRGTADGLTTALRREVPTRRYLGIELEVSQRFPLGPPAQWRALRGDLLASLRAALRRSDR